jgi:hypothetical protein
MKEREIQYLEEHIPELAESAVTQAYWQSLADGNSVLENENGTIYERFLDGSSKKMVKTISQRLGFANEGKLAWIIHQLVKASC